MRPWSHPARLSLVEVAVARARGRIEKSPKLPSAGAFPLITFGFDQVTAWLVGRLEKKIGAPVDGSKTKVVRAMVLTAMVR